ncbi:MAG: tail fiber domain-containing protein [Planctomycetota bacterium]
MFRSSAAIATWTAPAMAQDLRQFTPGSVASSADVNFNFSTVDSRARSALDAVNGLTAAITISDNRVDLNRSLRFGSSSNDNEFNGFGYNSNELRYSVAGPTDAHVFYSGTGATSSRELLRIGADGRVRIGTFQVPTQVPGDPQPALVVGGPTGPVGSYYFSVDGHAVFLYQAPQAVAAPVGAAYKVDASIYAEQGVVALRFDAKSDARIKKVHGRSDSANDLSRLLSIEVIDYHLLDTVVNGNRPQKKVIGQQVERVFPQAVSRGVNVIPDIYRRAPVNAGWIGLATDIAKGDMVRLIGLSKDCLHKVLEVTPEGFRTDYIADAPEVFVYGRQVDDFRTVDYEAIAMLNVSATQELARRCDSKDTEIASLREDNAALRSQFEALVLRQANEAA